MYGIDRYVLPPPLPALISLLLLTGCDSLGVTVLRACGLCAEGAPRWHRWQAPMVGAMALTLVLYPLALANLTPLVFMRAVALIVMVAGLVHAIGAVRSWRRDGWPGPPVDGDRTLRVWVTLVALLLMGAGLMSLAPPTDSDSLDYHLGVPVAQLIHGGIPVTPEWLHSRLAGGQEVLNTVGLAGGTDNFGAVLQFAGLAGIAALLIFADPDPRVPSMAIKRQARLMAAVAALSAPVVVALIAQKPQLLPVAMTSLALALIVYPSRRDLTNRAALQGYALVCLLALSAAQAKLSFMLTGGVVGLLAVAVLGRRGLLWPAIGLGVVALAIVLGPPTLWKYHHFHDTVLNSLVKVTPGNWPGAGEFDRHLRSFRPRGPLPYPVMLFVTFTPGSVSLVLGPAVLIVLCALHPHRDVWLWIVIVATGLVFLALAMLGPMLGRYYLEPIIWLLMVVALQPNQTALVGARWIAWPVIGQAIFTTALLWYGVASLLPGALTAQWRSAVMDRNANGYHVMKWADSVLPPDAVLLSANRSLALAPRDVVSFDWAAVVPVTSRAAEPFLRRLEERRVTHVLMGTSPQFTSISGCIGPVVAGPGDDTVAARNPFAAPATFPVWIYRFRSELLPECAFADP